MTYFQEIEAGDIQVGEPLQHSVHDKSGTLLIKAGGSIHSDHHLSILLDKPPHAAPYLDGPANLP